MLTLALRNVVAYRLRLLMSVIAVTLALAFVTGTLIFTGSLKATFASFTEGSFPHVEITADRHSAGSMGNTNPTELTEDDLTAVRAVPGVQRAEGIVVGHQLLVLDDRGKALGGMMPLGVSWSEVPSTTGQQATTIAEGHAPTRMNEVMIDESLAATLNKKVGDSLSMASGTDVMKFTSTISGITRPTVTLPGMSFVTFTTEAARRHLTAGATGYHRIQVQAAGGVSDTELVTRIKTEAFAQDTVMVKDPSGEGYTSGPMSSPPDDAAVPPAPGDVIEPDADGFVTSGQERFVTLKAGSDQTKDIAESTESGLTFITAFLLVFAGIATLVAVFLIVNTFTMIVAQRTRELALLRALGGSPQQVRTGVMAEAVIIGSVGGLLGVLVGYGLATGIRALIAQFGMDMGGMIPFPWATVLLSLVLGIVVTVTAASLPALRAARIPPVVAMQDDTVTAEHGRSWVTYLGAGMAALGLAGGVACLVWEDLPQRGVVLGLSGALLLIGAVMSSPMLGYPIVAGLGALYRRMSRGAGALAATNSSRNPRRTAATAAALMVGLSIVTAVGVAAESMKASIADLTASSMNADFVVTPSGFMSSFHPDILDGVRSVQGVKQVESMGRLSDFSMKYGSGSMSGSAQVLTPSGFSAFGLVGPRDEVQGSVEGLSASTIVVRADTPPPSGPEPSKPRLVVGDQVDVTVGQQKRTLTVAAVLPNTSSMGGMGDTYIHPDLMRELGVTERASQAAVFVDPGQDVAAVRTAVDDALQDSPTVTTRTKEEFAQQGADIINRMLAIVYALLALAIIIAVLGIINTLAMSVVERTREIGVLRAVGMTRSQVSWMVRLEAISVAVLGAVLGVVVGLVFGVAMQRLLASDGLEQLVIPWVTIGLGLVVSALVGLLAALWPAWQASRLNVLRAIATG